MRKECKVCRNEHDGPFLRCESCLEKQRQRSARYKKSGRGRATDSAYRQSEAGRELSRAAQVRYRSKDPERIRELNRQKAKRLYDRDPEKHRRRAADYARRNPVKRREAEARRRARKAGTQISPITMRQLEGRLAMFSGRCWICRVSEWEVWDHVKPLSRGGAHILANLRPACAPCNQQKYNKWPFDPAVREILTTIDPQAPLGGTP